MNSRGHSMELGVFLRGLLFDCLSTGLLASCRLGRRIPARIQGPLPSPGFELDRARSLRAASRQPRDQGGRQGDSKQGSHPFLDHQIHVRKLLDYRVRRQFIPGNEQSGQPGQPEKEPPGQTMMLGAIEQKRTKQKHIFKLYTRRLAGPGGSRYEGVLKNKMRGCELTARGENHRPDCSAFAARRNLAFIVPRCQVPIPRKFSFLGGFHPLRGPCRCFT